MSEITSKNILRGTRAYMIGAMEFQDGRGWRNTVKSELEPRGIICFDPYHKPFVDDGTPEDGDARKVLKDKIAEGRLSEVRDYMKKVRRDDLRLVDVSDFFIVNISPSIASWGSAEELFWANRLKKPIFLVVEGGRNKTPLWLLGTLPFSSIYESIDEVLEEVKNIDSGAKEITDSRWRILKESYRMQHCPL